MAYRLSKCLILHIPKTGSTWVRKACQRACECRITEIGEWHADVADVRRVDPELPLITFVRHPVTWYTSAWSYWMRTGRFPRQSWEPRVEHPDFPTFVRNCLSVRPEGYVTALYSRFVEGAIVGRQESLCDDLVRFLRDVGEPFSEAAIQTTGRENQGCPVDVPGDIARMIEKAEQTVIDQWYTTSCAVHREPSTK